jgi:hypothetical protein
MKLFRHAALAALYVIVVHGADRDADRLAVV